MCAVPAAPEGSGHLQRHAKDHPTGSRWRRQEVPERLGPWRVQEEQELHQPGESVQTGRAGRFEPVRSEDMKNQTTLCSNERLRRLKGFFCCCTPRMPFAWWSRKLTTTWRSWKSLWHWPKAELLQPPLDLDVSGHWRPPGDWLWDSFHTHWDSSLALSLHTHTHTVSEVPDHRNSSNRQVVRHVNN